MVFFDEVARRTLTDFNFEIEEGYDGQQCLDKVKVGNEYDLILMVIMMPNMSGETAIARLKENPNFVGVSYLENLGEPFGTYKTTLCPKYFNGDGFFISKIRRVK